MMKFLSALFIYSCSLFALSVQAVDCPRGNVYEELNCYKQQKSIAAKSINQQYHKLKQMNKLANHAEIVAAFEKSQKFWNQFVQADCQWINAPMSEAQGGGATINYHYCMLEHFEQREKQLRSFMKELQVSE